MPDLVAARPDELPPITPTRQGSDNVFQTKRSRRAIVLTPLITGLSAVSIWTLAHTDIAAFATVFVAGVVLVFGTLWATGPITSRQIANPSHPAGRNLPPALAPDRFKTFWRD